MIYKALIKCGFMTIFFFGNSIGAEYENIGKIEEIIPRKIYQSNGLSKSGQPIYFSIEFIDDINMEKWMKYKQQSDYKRHFYMSNHLLSKENRKSYFKESGFKTEEEYDSFCDNIIKNCSVLTQEKIESLISGYGGAIGAFDFYKNSEHYIAYVSTQPIKGYFDHPEDAISFKGYNDGYKNLLMCVRCKDILNTKVYNNRGIFKGLEHCFDKKYSNLAMELHRFTAFVFEDYFGKTHMSVAPLPKMYELMKREIPSEELITSPRIPEELDHFYGSFGLLDKKCVISTQTLKNYKG